VIGARAARVAVLATGLALGGLAWLASKTVKVPKSQTARIASRVDRRDRMGDTSASGGSSTPAATMTFLTSAPTAPAGQFCDIALDAGVLAGSYWCVNGDGTSTGLATTAIGSPTTTTSSTCATGVTCNTTVSTFDGTMAYRTAGVAAPAGDVSTVALINSSDVTSCRTFVRKHNAWDVYECAPTSETNHTINATTNIKSNAGSYVDVGTWNLWADSYDYTSSGSSLWKIYQNGYLMNSSSAAVGPLAAGSTVPWAFGADLTSAVSSTSGQFIGKFGGGLMTETALTQAQIQLLAVKLGRQLQDSLGNIISYAHNNAFTCDSDTGSVTPLGRDALCLLRGGISVNANVTASVPNPMASALTRTCQFATVDPLWGGWPISNMHVLDCGDATTTQNLTQLFIGNDGYLRGQVYDSAGASHLVTASTGGGVAVWGGPRRLGMCYGTTGIQLYEDNSQLTVADNGGGATSISVTQPTTCYIGQDGHNTGSTIPGAVKDGCFATDPASCTSTVPSRASATNKVAAIGDSVTRGQFATNSYGYPTLVEQAINNTSTTRVDNWARGSAKCSDMVNTWHQYVQGRGYTHLTVMCGVNDMFSDVTGASAWASLKTIADEARADGLTVVLLTGSPFGSSTLWSSARQTEYMSLRSSIQSYCTTNSLSCVDAYTILGDSVDATKLKATYDYGDGTHMTAAGNAALTSPLRTALGL
jgi:lysophospholipase L1-like esterase